VDLAASQARADQVASRARAVDPHLQVVIGVSLVSQVMTGAHGAQIHHPVVNPARADPAVVNLASQEALLALQEIGEVGPLPPQTNGVLQTLLLQERAARVDQDVNLVRAVRAVVPQAPQMIKDGESHVRVGVPQALPPVARAVRVAVAQARVERVAVPQARQAVHGRLMDGVDGVQTLARHPAVNLARVTQEGESATRSSSISSDISIYFEFTCMNADALRNNSLSSCVFIAV